MPPGLTRTVQADFSAGMFRGVREDLIPPNGVYDITNGLLDNVGAIYRRGGSSYRSTADFGTWIPMIWDGWVGATQRTVIASPTAFGLLNGDGSVTSLGGGGLSAPARPAMLGGTLYFPGGTTYDGVVGSAAKTGAFYAVAGNRLFVGSGNRVDFSAIYSGTGAPAFATTDFHLMPDGVQILGMQSLRNAVAVFTTGGVWIISNIGFDLTDASGNVQHRIDKYSSDLVLWGYAGIAAYEGGLVAPAADGVWLLSLGVESEARVPFARVSDPIERLYRSYVTAGYQPGQACTFNGHYFLPILNGSVPVDLLVCRLNTPQRPWSRLSGFGAQVASLTVRTSVTSARSPELIGGSAVAGRVLNLSYFSQVASSAFDADASAHPWSVQPRDIQTGPLNLNTITRMKIGYDLASASGSAPAITAAQLSGRQGVGGTLWGNFTWGGANWSAGGTPVTPLSGSAPVSELGSTYSWQVNKKERYARFRFDCSQAAAYLTLRWLEVYVRSSGRV
jgi:hypothetical protein